MNGRIADLELAARSAAALLRAAADHPGVTTQDQRDRWTAAARDLDDIARGTAPDPCPAHACMHCGNRGPEPLLLALGNDTYACAPLCPPEYRGSAR